MIGAILFITGISIVTTRIIITPHKSWWISIGILFGSILLCGFIALVIYMTRRVSVEEPIIKLSPEDAIKRAIYEKKYDENNADNFVPEWVRQYNVGEPSQPRTPILRVHGKGYELSQVWDALMNLNQPKGAITWLLNPTEKEVMDSVLRMAEHPESEIIERTSIGTDPYGRPIQERMVRKSLSPAEKEVKEEQKEAEEANVM
jgi:hypothetical protein